MHPHDKTIWRNSEESYTIPHEVWQDICRRMANALEDEGCVTFKRNSAYRLHDKDSTFETFWQVAERTTRIVGRELICQAYGTDNLAHYDNIANAFYGEIKADSFFREEMQFRSRTNAALTFNLLQAKMEDLKHEISMHWDNIANLPVQFVWNKKEPKQLYFIVNEKLHFISDIGATLDPIGDAVVLGTIQN